jgi:hypothetical protein
MAITYPLTFPTTKGATSSSWQLVSAVGYLESDFTFQHQVQEQQGERWEVAMTFPPMLPADAGAYRAFFAMLRGRLGTFLLGDYTRTAPLGAMGGTPLVNGAGQTGNTLNIDGVTNSTLVCKAGDWLQLGSGGSSRLHMVTADAISNGSGQVALTIVPQLRSSPADNAAVTFNNCKGVFRLAKNDVPIFSTSGPDHSRFSINAVEVLP